MRKLRKDHRHSRSIKSLLLLKDVIETTAVCVVSVLTRSRVTSNDSESV